MSKLELSCSAMNCEQGCVPNIEPGRNGTCFCNKGYKVTGSKQNRCKNINECEIWGICSQHCEDSDGSYKCSCQPGFDLQTDNKTCTVTGISSTSACISLFNKNRITGCYLIYVLWLCSDPNVKLVFATKKAVRVFNLKDGKQSSIVENSGQNIALAVDIASRKVLWADISSKREAIYRASLDGNGTVETLVDYGKRRLRNDNEWIAVRLMQSGVGV